GDISRAWVRAAPSEVSADGAEPASAILFPLALEVPGPQHIIDVVLRETLGALPFWPVWQNRAKAVLQFLHGQNCRDKIKSMLHPHIADPGVRAEAERSLATACERFAQWRWKTLRAACNGLLRMEFAFRSVCGPVRRVAELGVREGPQMAIVLEAAGEDAFWAQTRVLEAVTEPFSRLSGWLRGCACHEADLLRGRTVECQW
ncbi:MAG: hypothetical protein GY772_05315, partial [bacterium]|nr:hypothetical protein [bacterium]